MEKNKVMMIVIIALLVVLLASVAIVSFFAVRMMSNRGSEVEASSSNPAISGVLPLEQIWKYDLKDVISANLAVGADGINKHVITVGITIGVNGSDEKDKDYISLIEQIPLNDKVMSSIVLDILRNKTYEEVSSPEGKEVLQDEVLAKLQEAFNTNLIVTVYFYPFIYQ